MDALHKQLKEIVDDGDFISPDRAKELLELLDAAMSGGGLPENELDGDSESLHPSEEAAHEVFTLCDASSPYVAQAFPLFLRHLEPGIVRRLRDAVREASDIIDWVRVRSGPGVAPDLVLLLPAPTKGVVYWMRLRQVNQVLEGVEVRNG